MSGKNQYVVTAGHKWGVRGQGNEKITSLHNTQSQAIDSAREIARNQHSELKIQGRDSKFRDSDSYGHDLMPPRDKKN